MRAVKVIFVGENRSFDHLFATCVAPSGDSVLNLLSEGIINADGTPGPNFANAAQQQASDTTTYSVSPTTTGAYSTLPPPNLAYTPEYESYTGAPWISKNLAEEFDYGILPKEIGAATEGASGPPYATIDTRINNVCDLASGPFQLSPGVGSEDYADSPVHRFYQMFQQLDCNASYATATNPSGCRADLFPWTEVTVGAGADGNPPPPNYNDETTLEGATSMGFYNVQSGDAPPLLAGATVHAA